MTVSSLWTVLDEAGCGTPVSTSDFLDDRPGGCGRWRTILAVDLSIWICEGMTSSALSTFHADPACHLVYQRATKLLGLGIGLVFVAEGRRRSVREHRSGSRFWDASDRCEAMLRALGVPVARAEAEGEALCALLDSSGLVDGVISNDGDCLLYGARTVYSNFTSENLEEGRVLRYDAGRLSAFVVVAAAAPSESVGCPDGGVAPGRIGLRRVDLVAFGMICGSDVCGGGIPHCGHRKAVRFLDACRRTKGRCDDRACLDELLSWSDDVVAASASTKTVGGDICFDCDDDGPCTVPSRFCSICLHSGDKLRHEKYGCAECGTGPGECCIVVTSDEKFLRSMKEKALTSGSTLAPRHVVDQYFSPNGNSVPSSLKSLKSKPYAVSPDPATLFAMAITLKGRTKESSREYIKQTLPKLLARLDLWDTGPRNRYVIPDQKYKPVPIRIEKSVVRESLSRYEVTWSIIVSEAEDDAFQFCTCECQSLVDSAYPRLAEAFHREERRRKQGRAEDERRKRFTGAGDNHARRNNAQKRDERRMISKNPQAGGHGRKRERNFDGSRVSKVPKASSERGPTSTGLGLDVSLLIGNIPSVRDADESSDNETEDIDLGEECPEPNFHEWSDQFAQNVDITSAFSAVYHGDEESFGEGLHEIICCDPHLMKVDDALGCDDACHFLLPMHNDTSEDEYQLPYLRGSLDVFGYGHDRLASSEPSGGNRQVHRSDVFDLNEERLFCDFGVLHVAVSPIISRRCRLLCENGY
jgi:flap endonuclease GEN